MFDVVIVIFVVSGLVLLVCGGVSCLILVVGVDVCDYFCIVFLLDKIVCGEVCFGLNDLFIGVDLVNDLGVVVGDKLVLMVFFGV